jgi:hypothetical protein
MKKDSENSEDENSVLTPIIQKQTQKNQNLQKTKQNQKINQQ